MQPFTAQENTVIQTTTVSCYGIAFYGGFATYLFSMTPTIQQILGDNPGMPFALWPGVVLCHLPLHCRLGIVMQVWGSPPPNLLHLMMHNTDSETLVDAVSVVQFWFQIVSCQGLCVTVSVLKGEVCKKMCVAACHAGQH